MAAQKMSQWAGGGSGGGGGPPRSGGGFPGGRPANRLNNHHNSAGAKRNQEVIDLTDEDSSAPAAKRTTDQWSPAGLNGHPLGFPNPSSAPYSQHPPPKHHPLQQHQQHPNILPRHPAPLPMQQQVVMVGLRIEVLKLQHSQARVALRHREE